MENALNRVMSRPFVLLVFPGPMYRLEEALGQRLEGLSDCYDGYVLTSSPNQKATRIGDFEVKCLTSRGGKAILVAKYLAEIIRIAIRRRHIGGIDLIVAYDPLRSGLVGWLGAKIGGTKFIAEVNGDYWNLANFSEVRSELARKIKRRIYVAVERFVLSRADGIKLLYPTQLEPIFQDPPHPVIRSFPNLIQTGKFRNINDSQEVLSVGFPLHVKGMDILINAFKSISSKYPSWHLRILGFYPDRTEINRLIDGHAQIVVSDPVHPSEMPNILGRCEIFVLASRTESMGRVLVESMAAGKARIGTAVGGIPSVIEHYKDGLLVEPENPEALAQALQELIDSEELRHELGANGASRAAREFGPDSYFESTRSLYDDVLSS